MFSRKEKIMKGRKMRKIAVYGVAGLALAAMGVLVSLKSSGTVRADEPASAVLTTGGDIAAGQLVDETVYVFLEADGSVKKTISSDWTKNDLGADVYSKKEGKVSAPIKVNISYYLDGAKVSAEELRGRTGHVKIRYDYTNTERVNGYYMPYAVLSGMILSNEKFTNISTKNAKLMNDGTRTTIVGLALPGMRENLGVSIELPEYVEIEADVKEFALEMTATVATSKIFAEIDTSALNSVEALSSQLNTLVSAMTQLINGSEALSDGLSTLNDKSGLLASGVSQLQAGATKLLGGMNSLTDGLGLAATGSNELAQKIGMAANAAKQLDAGVAGAMEKMSGQMSDLSTNSTTIANMANAFIDGTISELANNPLMPGITVDNYEEKIGNAISTLKGMGDNDNAAKLETTLKQLKFYQAIVKYANGIMTELSGLPTELAELKKGTAALADGLPTAAEKTGELSSKLSEAAAGSKELATGMGSLSAGLDNLASNMPALQNGVAQLSEGSKSLTSGLLQFSEEGVQKLVALYNGNVKALIQRIRAIVEAAGSGAKVKYIYRTPEI